MKSEIQYGRLLVVLSCLLIGCVPLGAADEAAAPVAAEVNANEPQGLVPVFRFWSPTLLSHFYTIDESEKDWLIATYPDVWTFEGIAYQVYASEEVAGLKPVFRFWSPTLLGHFYTMDGVEKDWLIATYPNVWTFEGIAFYAYPEEGQPADTSPVFRFWSPTLLSHFYTIDESEKDWLIATYPDVWTFEGAAWYAHKDPNGVGPTPGEVFEFTGGSEEISCTLTLRAYVDGIEARIDDDSLSFVPQVASMKIAADFNDLVATIEDVVVESQFLQHTTTIRGGAQDSVVIPMTLSSAVIFWAATPRGPYAIDPQSFTFPTSPKVSTGANETFSLAGSVTVDGNKTNVGVAVRATRFSEGQGTFDTSMLPELLDVQFTQAFVWSRSQHEDRLLLTTVQGHQLQLYVISAQVRMTGLWQGEQPQ